MRARRLSAAEELASLMDFLPSLWMTAPGCSFQVLAGLESKLVLLIESDEERDAIYLPTLRKSMTRDLRAGDGMGDR